MKLSVSTIGSLTIGGLNSRMTDHTLDSETTVIPSGMGREPRDVAGQVRDIAAPRILAG
jgi:hypothetical protein